MALKERVITGRVRSDRKLKREIKSHLFIKAALPNRAVSLLEVLPLKNNDSRKTENNDLVVTYVLLPATASHAGV